MSESKSKELRVSVDVGYRRHRVAMGLSGGGVLEEFEIEHRIEGFEDFFFRIEKYAKQQLFGCHCKGRFNGWARHSSACCTSAAIGFTT